MIVGWQAGLLVEPALKGIGGETIGLPRQLRVQATGQFRQLPGCRSPQPLLLDQQELLQVAEQAAHGLTGRLHGEQKAAPTAHLAKAAGQGIAQLQLPAQAQVEGRLQPSGQQPHGGLGVGADGIQRIKQQQRRLTLYRQMPPAAPALPGRRPAGRRQAR
ncbi:hypothetical protein FQZ97_901880 [compost metagenome]